MKGSKRHFSTTITTLRPRLNQDERFTDGHANTGLQYFKITLHNIWPNIEEGAVQLGPYVL